MAKTSPFSRYLHHRLPTHQHTNHPKHGWVSRPHRFRVSDVSKGPAVHSVTLKPHWWQAQEIPEDGLGCPDEVIKLILSLESSINHCCGKKHHGVDGLFLVKKGGTQYKIQNLGFALGGQGVDPKVSDLTSHFKLEEALWRTRQAKDYQHSPRGGFWWHLQKPSLRVQKSPLLESPGNESSES